MYFFTCDRNSKMPKLDANSVKGLWISYLLAGLIRLVLTKSGLSILTIQSV